MSSIGRRLMQLREAFRLTQEEIGERLGLARSSWGRHERNECLPTGKMLISMAHDFDASLDYLMVNRGELIYKGDEPGAVMDEEIREMVGLMNQSSVVRHSVMSFYKRFKLENRELIAKDLESEEKQ